MAVALQLRSFDRVDTDLELELFDHFGEDSFLGLLSSEEWPLFGPFLLVTTVVIF